MSSESRMSAENFVQKARKMHGERYDYSKAVYVLAKLKVIITCALHGDFAQAPLQHIHEKQGCPTCSGRKKPTLEEFVDKAKTVFGASFCNFDYSKVSYINNRTKVEIICKLHGPFYMTPHAHLKRHGCRKCNISFSQSQIACEMYMKLSRSGLST